MAVSTVLGFINTFTFVVNTTVPISRNDGASGTAAYHPGERQRTQVLPAAPPCELRMWWVISWSFVVVNATVSTPPHIRYLTSLHPE